MTYPKRSTEKLLARCFSVEEMKRLTVIPEFSEAVSRMHSVDEALAVIDLGQRLLRPPSPDIELMKLSAEMKKEESSKSLIGSVHSFR